MSHEVQTEQLFDILVRAQRDHIAMLSKEPNDFLHGAQSFLDYLEQHDGEFADVYDLIYALDIDEGAATVMQEGETWHLKSIAPNFLYVVAAEVQS